MLFNKYTCMDIIGIKLKIFLRPWVMDSIRSMDQPYTYLYLISRYLIFYHVVLFFVYLLLFFYLIIYE